MAEEKRTEKTVWGKAADFLKAAGKRIAEDIRTYWGFCVLFVIYDVLAHFLFDAFCPSVIVAGLPCPGCGMTRAVFFFATGQIARGWNMNPLGILWFLLAVYFCVMRYGLGRRPRGVLQIGGVIIGLMVLLYLYRMYLYFPGEPPISYTPGSLLERILPEYGQRVHEIIGKIRA